MRELEKEKEPSFEVLTGETPEMQTSHNLSVAAHQ